MPCRRHPVSRQHYPFEIAHGSTTEIRESFTDGDASGRGRIQQRQRCAFAHTHGFAADRVIVGQGNRGVGNRYLPGPYHLITSHQPADRSITNTDQKGLVGHRRQTQHAIKRSRCIDTVALEFRLRDFLMGDIAVHFRWLAEQYFERQINR